MLLILFLLLVLGIAFLRGLFRFIIPIIIGLLILHALISSVFWLLNPHILLPLLIIAGIFYLYRRLRRN